MSKNLTSAAVIAFDNEVKHEYQGMKTLRNTVSLRTNVVGESYKFTRMGKGLANQKATQADVTPMDISHARQTATMQNWNAPEYTDIFDQREVNFDERQELAQTIAKAIGRREDQLVLDVLENVSYAATNDQNADTGRIIDISGTRNFDFEAVRQAAQHLNEIEAEANDRHFVIQAGVLNELLSVEQVSSSDYVSIKALMNGELNTWMGFTWHVIGVRSEGGISGVTGDEHAYAYCKSALGLAVGMDMKTSIDWVAQKTSWLCNGMYKAGSVAREPQGIVQIQYNETT